MDLQNKYRPKSFDDIYGQKHIVNSLKAFGDSLPHAILFTGPSGTGKTTLARILANNMGCSPTSLIEIDGATFSGIDSMRDIAEGLLYKSMDSPVKFVVIDECHMLSKSAWNSWLKNIEEPPSFLYFVFCTTEIDKVPNTIRTRCAGYELSEVSKDDLFDLLEKTIKREEIKLPKDSIELIIQESNGSPRQALVYLSQIRDTTSIKEVSLIIKSAVEVPEVIDLCRLLTGKGVPKWEKAVPILRTLKTYNPESVRIQMSGWFTACALNSKSDTEVLKFLRLLEIFKEQFPSTTGFNKLVLCVGEAILGE